MRIAGVRLEVSDTMEVVWKLDVEDDCFCAVLLVCVVNCCHSKMQSPVARQN